MNPVRRIAASFAAAVLLTLVLASCAAAQQGGQQGSTDELGLHAYALRYRQAGDALPFISPLLSKRGTVELQPATNTLVIRDTMAALNRIIPVLRSFDHPARRLVLELYLVKASRSQVSPPVPHSDLPDPLTRRLRSLFAYDIYDVQAQAQLGSQEGQAVTYAVAEEYEVSFRLGTVSGDQQVRLSDFKLVRLGERRANPPRPLIHANLNLRLDQTTSLGLARSESSPEALMIVLTLRSGEVPRRLQRAESQ